MRERKVIKLQSPLRAPEGPVSQIVLREPTFDEYLSIGDPYTVAYTDDGSAIPLENTENIKLYIAKCLVEPKDPAILQQAGAIVAREVKQALMGFFRPDEAESEVSETLPTS